MLSQKSLIFKWLVCGKLYVFLWSSSKCKTKQCTALCRPKLFH